MDAFVVSLLIAVNVMINVGGTFLLKFAATSGNVATGIMGCACYVFAAALFVLVVKEQPLSLIAVVTSMLALLASVAIGVLVFKEAIAPIHMIGIALALGAVVLISLPVKTG